jgi:hypothetical protein
VNELEEIRRIYDENAAAPDPEAAARAWSQIAARIDGEQSPGAAGRSRPFALGHRRRARPITPGVGRWLTRRPARVLSLAAAAAMAAAAVILVPGGGGLRESASAATVALREAAAVARVQAPPRFPGPGEFLYTKSIDAHLYTSVYQSKTVAVLMPEVRETWHGAGGGLLRARTGTPRFISERDRERWIAAGRPPLGGHDLLETRLGAAEPLDLPSDPDALYERLARSARGHDSGLGVGMFALVGDALRETASTPAQRAALYEVASRLPGIRLLGQLEDPAGRPGIAVAIDDRVNGIRQTLIFDPDTSQLLAEEQAALANNPFGYPAGTALGHGTSVESAVVGSLGEQPSGRRGQERR